MGHPILTERSSLEVPVTSESSRQETSNPGVFEQLFSRTQSPGEATERQKPPVKNETEDDRRLRNESLSNSTRVESKEARSDGDEAISQNPVADSKNKKAAEEKKSVAAEGSSDKKDKKRGVLLKESKETKVSNPRAVPLSQKVVPINPEQQSTTDDVKGKMAIVAKEGDPNELVDKKNDAEARAVKKKASDVKGKVIAKAEQTDAAAKQKPLGQAEKRAVSAAGETYKSTQSSSTKTDLPVVAEKNEKAGVAKEVKLAKVAKKVAVSETKESGAEPEGKITQSSQKKAASRVTAKTAYQPQNPIPGANSQKQVIPSMQVLERDEAFVGSDLSRIGIRDAKQLGVNESKMIAAIQQPIDSPQEKVSLKDSGDAFQNGRNASQNSRHEGNSGQQFSEQ